MGMYRACWMRSVISSGRVCWLWGSSGSFSSVCFSWVGWAVGDLARLMRCFFAFRWAVVLGVICGAIPHAALACSASFLHRSRCSWMVAEFFVGCGRRVLVVLVLVLRCLGWLGWVPCLVFGLRGVCFLRSCVLAMWVPGLGFSALMKKPREIVVEHMSQL